jgi:hypothetical protein
MSLYPTDQEQLTAQFKADFEKALKTGTDAIDDQVLFAQCEFDQAAKRVIKDVQAEAARTLEEARKEIAGLREHVKQLEGHFREEDESMGEVAPPYKPFALADDFSNMPAEGTPPPMVMTYRGRTLAGHGRVGLALLSVRRLGRIPESVYRDPLGDLDNELNRLSLGKTPEETGMDAGDSTPPAKEQNAKKRKRRQRRPRRPARERRESRPYYPRLPQFREPAWRPSNELKQAQADLVRIRAERERLRLEVQALKSHCRSSGIGEPRVPLPPASCFGPGKT